ncbi:N-acetylneuraminate synthase family protein [Halorarum halobium]|uniref:N-acetylneuraminate synthase family protein n=1 Tax=Halorarum halobium TaxID=3075121 RepID=UPI0028AAB305|nr:N-acetylneuraminate synthase family protein [Halobaculum sp. XH14]
MVGQIEFLNGNEPYIIAEVGGNHGGSVDKAKDYATAAAEAGVDSVKFQLYQAENLITKDEPPLPLAGDEYESQYERFKELELTRSEWRDVIDHCYSLGVDFSASVFDAEMLEFAIDDMPFIKIASGDLTNLPLLRKVQETGKPIVLSTGFSTFEEIRRTMTLLSDASVVLLHCMGSYPTSDEDANLMMVEALQNEFDTPTGYSDHTVGILAPIAAVARGAQVVEKHFTLDKSKKVGDHRLSATPEQMEELVDESRRVARMSGRARDNEVYLPEKEIRNDMRRSLATKKSIKEGKTITEEDLTALRPSDGVSPMRLDEVIGTSATRNINANQILQESDFGG